MKDKEYIKISVVGDIMCELPQLKASKINGKYEFDDIFKNIKDYLKESDYVIGNLETPISQKHKLTNELYRFNTPIEFLKSIKKADFNLLVTANNHCLDRGVSGLKLTMNNILKLRMNYVGTRIYPSEKKYFEKKIKNTKIAFLAYTYGTNCTYNHKVLPDNKKFMVNLLKEQYPSYYKPLKEKLKFIFNNNVIMLKNVVKKLINYKIKYQFDPSNSIVVDEIGKNEWVISSEKIDCIKNDITNSKKDNDVSILFIHSGGQFNSEPGDFTETIMSELSKTNIDCIIGTHPHVVQKSEFKNKKFITYCLGNFSISPSTVYLNHDLLPDYSILLNIYIDKKTKKIKKYTFSILKTVEDDNHYLSVYMLYDLIKSEKNEQKKQKLIEDNLFIYNRFSNKNVEVVKIEKEYTIRK